MAEESSDDDARSVVHGAIEDPAVGRRSLPRLLGLLDADEESVRLGACWAICRVVVADPAAVPYLVRRVADRLETDPSLAVELLWSYLAARHPETVADELDSHEDADHARDHDLRGDARGVDGSPAGHAEAVGRTRLPGEGALSALSGAEGGNDPTRPRSDADSESADGGNTATAETPGEATEDGDADPLAPDPAGGRGQPPELLAVITYQSVFNTLSVVRGRDRTRYGDRYRTLGVRDGEELGVGLTLFHRPSADRHGFARDLAEALERWGSVDGHDNVVSLYDWGTDPRPWATSEYTDLTLRERGPFPSAVALWNARRLADAVAHVHENGVVHGGIDPGNVAYYGNVLDNSERQPPMLTNVGLLGVLREHFDPTRRLDPRYAAPEYFDRRYGRIDHATDIYHLGAVCYRLFTGEHPVDGSYDDVRSAILDGRVRRPSEVADVPPAVDDIVTKAMAREKLRRYESITHMRAEHRATGGSPDA